MATPYSTAELTLAHIALGLDTPAAPAHQPPDPAHAVETCQQYLKRCQRLLSEARTAQERRDAELWVWNAENQLARWQAQAARAVQL